MEANIFKLIKEIWETYRKTNEIGKQARMFVFIPLSHHFVWCHSKYCKAKEIKGVQIRKEELQLLLADDIEHK